MQPHQEDWPTLSTVWVLKRRRSARLRCRMQMASGREKHNSSVSLGTRNRRRPKWGNDPCAPSRHIRSVSLLQYVHHQCCFPSREFPHTIQRILISFIPSFPSPQFYGDPTFSTTLLSSLFTLFSNASLRVARAEIVPDGLAGVRRGLESLRDGSAPGGRKCVIRLADTPSAELTNLGVRSELGWNGVP